MTAHCRLDERRAQPVLVLDQPTLAGFVLTVAAIRSFVDALRRT